MTSEVAPQSFALADPIQAGQRDPHGPSKCPEQFSAAADLPTLDAIGPEGVTRALSVLVEFGRRTATLDTGGQCGSTSTLALPQLRIKSHGILLVSMTATLSHIPTIFPRIDIDECRQGWTFEFGMATPVDGLALLWTDV